MIEVLRASPLSETSAEYAQMMGEACSLMTKSPTYCQYPVVCLHEWIRPALLLGQFALLKDHYRRSIGYLTWAYLSPTTERRLVGDPDVLLHLSEWNEGSHLWVLDLLLLEGPIHQIKKALLATLSGSNGFWYLRRNSQGEVTKTVRWGKGDGRWRIAQQSPRL